MDTRKKNMGNGNKGQTLVEFALILLLLVSILFGITEFGRAWYHSNALVNGTRAGARFASTFSSSTGFEAYKQGIRNYTFAQITSAIPVTAGSDLLVNISSFDLNGNPVNAIPPVGGSVKVIAEERFNILTGSIIPFFSGTRTLIRQTTMRYQGS